MSDAFEVAWDVVKNEEKRSSNRFKGYSKNRISGRAERAGKARAWSQSRKVKRGRTRRRYARNKTRGNVRPKLRRQLGAGGERIQVKKTDENRPTIPTKWRRNKPTARESPERIGAVGRSIYGRGGSVGRTTGPTGEPLRESLYCIRPNCDRKLSDSSARKPARIRQCGSCARVHGLKGLEDKRIEHLRLMREQRAGDTGGVDPGDVAPT